MDMQRLTTIMKNIGYKPDTSFRIGWMGSGFFIQHRQTLADCKVPEMGATEQRGRKLYISKHMTESEVLQTALLCVMLFEKHEAREWFTYHGKELYGPHIDISQKEVRA